MTNDENSDEIAEFERLFGDLPPTAGLDGTQRAFLDRLPAGREIYWRDEVLAAPLPQHLQALTLDDVERIYSLTLRDRVRVIRAGVPGQALLDVLKAMSRSRLPDFLAALGLDIEDTFLKASEEQMLDMGSSEKALGLVRLLGHLRRHGSGNISFDDFGRWLVTWHPALDLAPVDFIGSVTALSYLEGLIAGD